MPPRHSRPGSAQPPRSRAQEGPPAITVEFLRQRITQMETAAREAHEEVKRNAAQREREIDALRHEYDDLQKRLDEVRMEECMTPAELAAARSDHTGGAGSGSFKLVASNTPAYRQAKALVEEKRRACEQAEQDLDKVRTQLTEVREGRVGARRLRYASAVEAYMQAHALRESNMQIRDLVKVLEANVAKELDKLSEMTSNAKALRGAIDAKLVTQTRYEKNYGRRVNDLLDCKKQMAFLTEVCQTLFDERALATEELRRMQLIARREDGKYDAAFEELTAVEQQNLEKQAENAQRVQRAREQLSTAREERLMLEAKNEKTKREAQNGRMHTTRTRTAARSSPGLEETARPVSAEPSGYCGAQDVGGGRLSTDSEKPTLDSSSVEGRIAIFESYLNRLSDIAGAETARDVVNFLEASADDRFRCFSEVRAIEEEMQQLALEKAKLVEEAGALGVPSSEEQAERVVRMRALRKELTTLKAESLAQEEYAAEGDLLFDKVVEQIEKMFTGLGCSVPDLRSTTGSERVTRATCSEALALIEQRIEEYLIAYSRRQQQLAARKGTSTAGDRGLFEAAKPILRRGDLPAKTDANSAEVAMQSVKSLPYSGEVGDDLHTGSSLTAPEDRVLQTEELRRIAQRRLQT